MNIKVGDVWLVNFPLEEDPSVTFKRPVVVLDTEVLKVLSVKVTKHKPRTNDDFDVPIVYWQEAKLRFQSTARVAKLMNLDKSMFIHKIGELHQDDFNNIVEKFKKFIEKNK